MLIRLLSHSPFEKPRTERLICLETHLRQKSESTITLKHYLDWLEQANITIPTRRTLNEDLKRYANFCDDVRYGGDTKSLSLTPSATKDAITWFMGNAWLDAPLRPRLFSSCVRCLLLARELQSEVDFPYNPLRKPGQSWIPQTAKGIPLRLIPGADSGYMQLWREWGGKSIFNLARIPKYVCFTGNSAKNYAPLQKEQFVLITVKSDDRFILERLKKQFPNFVVEERQRVILQIEKSLALMTTEMLKAHLARTQNLARNIHIKQKIGNATLYYEELKEEPKS